MRITKRQLKRIIREERQRILRELHDPLDPHVGGRPLSKSIQEIFAEAGLTPKEVAETREELEEGWSGVWADTSAYQKLYDVLDIPYEIDSQSMGAEMTPDEWILDYLESLA